MWNGTSFRGKQQKEKIGMSEETKQQKICSAVFSLSCINLLKDGRRDNKKFINTPEQKWVFFIKGFSSIIKIINLKLQSYLLPRSRVPSRFGLLPKTPHKPIYFSAMDVYCLFSAHLLRFAQNQTWFRKRLHNRQLFTKRMWLLFIVQLELSKEQTRQGPFQTQTLTRKWMNPPRPLKLRLWEGEEKRSAHTLKTE